jgi:hypothetical protein
MNHLRLYGKRHPVAGKWNELNREQLLRIMAVLFSPATEPQLQAKLLPILLELRKWKNRRMLWQCYRMPLLDAADCTQLVEFLISHPVALTKQLLPSIRPTWYARPWYGPGDMLAGLTFAEWIDAETTLYQYRMSKKPQHLHRLVAILYRPGRREPHPSTGDRRLAYTTHQLDARTAEAAKLAPAVHQAILVYYDSCRQVLIQQHPDVFNDPDDDDADNPDRVAPPPQNPAPAYLRILRELANTPDRFEVIGQQPIGNILFDVASRIQQTNETLKRLAESNP